MSTQMLNVAVALYFILAIGYNLLSLALRDMNKAPLAPTEPVQAIVMMSLLYVIYASEEVLGCCVDRADRGFPGADRAFRDLPPPGGVRHRRLRVPGRVVGCDRD